MTCEDAYVYLMKFSWKIGTDEMKELSYKEGTKFREAVQTLYFNAACSALEDEYELSQHNS